MKQCEHAIRGVIERCSEAIKDVAHFYTEDFVNYTGMIGGIPCTEIVAGFVIRHLDFFDRIPMITREKSYYSGHMGAFNPGSPRKEEIDAIRMFNQCKDNPVATIGDAGHIIDYQIPLKNKRSDKAGKIDLLSEDEDTVYALELKQENSDETLLRCVLEGYTYIKTVNKDKLFDDYGIDCNKSFKTAPLIYEDSQPGVDYYDILNGNRPNLRELMKKLNVSLFFLSKEGDVFHSSEMNFCLENNNE